MITLDNKTLTVQSPLTNKKPIISSEKQVRRLLVTGGLSTAAGLQIEFSIRF